MMGLRGLFLFLAKISGPVSGFVMQARRGKKSINWLLKNQKNIQIQRCEQNEVPEPLATGLYDGESSIVYVYLILYEITGQEKWIKNAQKHFEIVAKLLPKDENMDYLSGNAGAIVAANETYQLTGEIE